MTNQNNLLVSRCLLTHSVHFILDHEKETGKTPLFPRLHITYVYVTRLYDQKHNMFHDMVVYYYTTCFHISEHFCLLAWALRIRINVF